jgi:hypothetical protein
MAGAHSIEIYVRPVAPIDSDDGQVAATRYLRLIGAPCQWTTDVRTGASSAHAMRRVFINDRLIGWYPVLVTGIAAY